MLAEILFVDKDAKVAAPPVILLVITKELTFNVLNCPNDAVILPDEILFVDKELNVASPPVI